MFDGLYICLILKFIKNFVGLLWLVDKVSKLSVWSEHWISKQQKSNKSLLFLCIVKHFCNLPYTYTYKNTVQSWFLIYRYRKLNTAPNQTEQSRELSKNLKPVNRFAEQP